MPEVQSLPLARTAGLRRVAAVLMTLMVPFFSAGSLAQEAPDHLTATSINLEDVPYPYPVSYIEFDLYDNPVRMVYMDVEPTAAANGRTVVLLHGMNWYAEYWGE